MHSMWTVHILFTTVKSVPQSQQMRAKKNKKAENVKMKTWTRYANGHQVLFKIQQVLFLFKLDNNLTIIWLNKHMKYPII